MENTHFPSLNDISFCPGSPNQIFYHKLNPHCSTIDEMAGCEIYFKMWKFSESRCFQKLVGSAMLSHDTQLRTEEKGVATHSKRQSWQLPLARAATVRESILYRNALKRSRKSKRKPSKIWRGNHRVWTEFLKHGNTNTWSSSEGAPARHLFLLPDFRMVIEGQANLRLEFHEEQDDWRHHDIQLVAEWLLGELPC